MTTRGSTNPILPKFITTLFVGILKEVQNLNKNDYPRHFFYTLCSPQCINTKSITSEVQKQVNRRPKIV